MPTQYYPDGEYDEDGYDRDGFDRAGFNEEGYDRDGYNEDGYDSLGYDRAGYDGEGYDGEGYDRDGFDIDGYNEDGYNEDGFDRDGQPYRCTCATCRCEPDGREGLAAYDYQPAWRLRGSEAPYYGLEIEVTTDHVSALMETVDEYAGSLVFCKYDSSVDGAEMVSHPMSFDWAMTNFPWRMLPRLRETADATTISSTNGIHIHVGRDGFDGPAHVFRWLKLWYRNPSDIQRIARRRAPNWAGFSPEHRAAHKEHAKYDHAHYDRYADDTRHERYSAINTTNAKTLEVRVFASTLRPQRAQAALQLVAGSVEYTRQLTADAVCHRHGWDWRAFMAWVKDTERYPALVTEDRIRNYL